VVVTDRGASGAYERFGKPVLDRGLAVILLLATLPVLIAVAAAIRLRLGPGVIFRQQRVGREGRQFCVYKFRTMEPDRRRTVAEVPGEDRRRLHKTERDPRHTPLGRFLRSSSLDELPQLWNVVRGDMSLVGPRPELVSIVDRHDLWDHPRHRVRPGITGVWQISPARTALLHEGVHLDLDYIADVTFRRDVRIMFGTVAALLRRTGS
jgi:lipopolysaccharide/colanic/teichoic acid biosynthesis glycosyltransferase